jgi:hypothetical protein
VRSLILFAFVCACSSNSSFTKGKKGRASFAYRATPGCEDGCDLDRNAVVSDGATQLLLVTGADFGQVSSSAPEIASFMKTADGVVATTGMAGDVDLILQDASAGEVDRVTLHIVAAAKLKYTAGWGSAAGPILLENVPITMAPVQKEDSNLRILFGHGAVRFTGSAISTIAATSMPDDIQETIVLEGPAGAANLNLANGSQSVDIPIQIVSISGLSKLTLDLHGTFLGSSGTTVDSPVDVTVSSPDGPVYGASCAWSVSDPSVQIVVTQTTDHLALAPTGNVTFKMTRVGSFTATCTLGALTAMVPLKRDS